MSDKPHIYLSGCNLYDPKDSRWSTAMVERFLNLLSPHDVVLLNPSDRDDDLSNEITTVGRNSLQLFVSDLMVVDASKLCDLSLGADLLWAKENDVFVISIVPPTSPYCKSDATFLGQTVNEWVHPYIGAYSDLVVEDIESAAEWIVNSLTGEETTFLKNNLFTLQTMQIYVEDELDNDEPFTRLMEGNPELEEFVHSIADMMEDAIKDDIEEAEDPLDIHKLFQVVNKH
jgi:hypothetical protein